MDIAEDIVQDIFADVWNTRDELSKEGSFQAFLYKLVKNRALDYLSHLRVVKKYEEEIDYFLRKLEEVVNRMKITA